MSQAVGSYMIVSNMFFRIFCAIALAAVTVVSVAGSELCFHRFAKTPRYDYSKAGRQSLWEMFAPDQTNEFFVVNGDTLRFIQPRPDNGRSLTDCDYRQVARQLGIDIASIKAIVEIETGRTHRGFNDDGSPIVNFDLRVFRTMASRRKIDLDSFEESHPLVFSEGGATQSEHHARLCKAMSIDSVAAIQSTFWGMFQIGGFNWKSCGASSVSHFVELMSASERSQLDLFAEFIRSSGLLPLLQAKDWSAFARGYNGPSYAEQGYHTRLAEAYQKYGVN